MVREFIFYSKSAVTSGSFVKEDLKKAGRMDIVCNTILSAFFISNKAREDVKFHLILDGPPNNPQHIVLESNENLPISKKDIAGLIKRLLYKSPQKEGLIEVFPGAKIEKKSFEKLITDLEKEKRDIYLLDKKGKDIREHKIKEGQVFIIGDHEGFPKEKRKFLRKIEKLSVGPFNLFASQVITLIHNEMDRTI